MTLAAVEHIISCAYDSIAVAEHNLLSVAHYLDEKRERGTT